VRDSFLDKTKEGEPLFIEAGSQAKITTGRLIGSIASSMAGGSAATGSLIGGAGEKYNQQGHHTAARRAEIVHH